MAFVPKSRREGKSSVPKVTEEQITKLRLGILDANKYRLEQSDIRNVLVVGRTRSGKSTAVGVLKDPTFQPKDFNIFSDTEVPQFLNFSLSCLEVPEEERADVEGGNMNYTLSVIDSPGLMDVRPRGNEIKPDELILQSINACLKNEVTKIHCLLIFVSVQAGITNDDVECFRKYYDSFYHKDVPVLVCVTRAEDKNDAWKENITDQLHNHPKFADLLERENVPLCFMGCVDGDATRNAGSIEALNDLYAEVFEMREIVLEKIFQSKHAVSLLDLPASKEPQRRAKVLLDAQLELLGRLEECKDFAGEEAQSLIAEIEAADREMKNLRGYLEVDDDTTITRIRDYKNRKLAIGEKMNADVAREFLGPLYSDSGKIACFKEDAQQETYRARRRTKVARSEE
jgi:hypothetical protein